MGWDAESIKKNKDVFEVREPHQKMKRECFTTEFLLGFL